MRRIKKLSFEELVKENKRLLMNDKEALERLEERWERKIIGNES